MNESVFDELMATQADPALFDAFGQKAIYNNRTVVDATLDQDVERVNSYGESIRSLYEVTVMNAQVGNLKKGDSLEFNGEIYKIVDIIVSNANVTIGEASRGA